jgi:hypothetical protein
LREGTALSREDRMAKMQTIRGDSNAKIKAVLNDDQKKQHYFGLGPAGQQRGFRFWRI